MTTKDTTLDLATAQKIIDAFDKEWGQITNLRLFDHSEDWTIYDLEFSSDSESSSLTVTVGGHSSLSGYIAIREVVDDYVKTPRVLKVDHSNEIVESSYIILERPRGTDLTSFAKHDESLRSAAFLRYGSLLRDIHSNVQNDWFGVPCTKEDAKTSEWAECYSWQECFSLLLEEALSNAVDANLIGHNGNTLYNQIQVEEIRKLLSNAIAYFLFDDVEVPSLVININLDWQKSLLASSPSGDNQDIRLVPSPPSLLPAASLWGDPLMEGAFAHIDTSDSSDRERKVIEEGYGSPSLIVFPRQRTKRLWYTMYTVLQTMLVNVQEGNDVEARSQDDLRRLLNKIVTSLRTAPTY